MPYNDRDMSNIVAILSQIKYEAFGRNVESLGIDWAEQPTKNALSFKVRNIPDLKRHQRPLLLTVIREFIMEFKYA